jgi:LPXTG-site transpeptidase (sortase) family protein
MKKKNLFTLLFIAAIFAGIIGSVVYFFSLPNALPNDKLAIIVPDKLFGWKFPVVKLPSTGTGGQIAYSSIRDPGGVPQGLPVRLKIPIIGVDSAVEDALITVDGRMDVPLGSVNVAWFALGPHPGQVGSAVIGGHFGINNGKPFVFYKLDKLKTGDKVSIVDDAGKTTEFIVRSIKLFERNADATTVFTSSDGLAHLNLITCEGIWNQVNGTYPERRVVFTDAVVSVASDPSLSPVTVFTQSLSLGARGADVVALQTALEQKGFLKMPAGIAKGYFGALTASAVSKYQSSVGLSQIGVFGPLTRVKLNEELKSGSGGLPITGGDLASTKPILTRQAVILSVKNLFATPIDGMVTFLLLLLIIFISIKIIRR